MIEVVIYDIKRQYISCVSMYYVHIEFRKEENKKEKKYNNIYCM